MIMRNRLWFGQIISAKHTYCLDSPVVRTVSVESFDHIVLLITIVDNDQFNKWNLEEENNLSEMDHFGV